jgi:hypothetical protein
VVRQAHDELSPLDLDARATAGHLERELAHRSRALQTPTSLAGGEAARRTLGQQRCFVWSVYRLVDAYATVMITVFWTYANDVVSRAQADRLYAPIGVGGILGGIARRGGHR